MDLSKLTDEQKRQLEQKYNEMVAENGGKTQSEIPAAAEKDESPTPPKGDGKKFA